MIRLPVVIVNGEYGELSAADVLGGSIVLPNPPVVTLTFGPVAKYQQTFTITDAAAVMGRSVQVFAVPDSDEYEMDTLSCMAYVASAGIVSIIVTAVPGPIIGDRRVAYILY